MCHSPNVCRMPAKLVNAIINESNVNLGGTFSQKDVFAPVDGPDFRLKSCHLAKGEKGL